MSPYPTLADLPEALRPWVLGALVLAILLGFVAAWIWRGRQINKALWEREQARANAELRRDEAFDMRSRLAAAETEADRVADLEQRLDQARLDGDRLLEDRTRLAAAAERLPTIEAELVHNRQRVEGLALAKTKLEETLRQTEAAHSDKVMALSALREDIDARLRDMAATTLKQSQASLLEVTERLLKAQRETTGAEHQQRLAAAQSDLAARQVAIDGIVKPVGVALLQYQQRLAALEQDTATRYGSLTEQLKSVVSGQEQVRGAAAGLAMALRAAPKTRGRWGEHQLRRVMELAGMSERVDYVLEASVPSESGRLRPDAVIQLPGDRQIVVDAKTSLSAYLESLDAPDEAMREGKLTEHARQLRQHVTILAAKDYWAQFERAPDFVAMFVPGENFYSAAAERDPDLFEYAIARKVLIVTPTTLIALAKAVAYGWGQVRTTEHAREIAQLGNELYTRIATLTEPVEALGKSLASATTHYNKFIGSLESRVLPATRRLAELTPGESPKEVKDLEEIDTVVRQLRRDGA